MLREYGAASVVGRALAAKELLCTLAGILLEGVSVEVSGLALGVAGYGLAAKSGDRAGQVLGVVGVVLCALSVAIPSLALPGLFLES